MVVLKVFHAVDVGASLSVLLATILFFTCAACALCLLAVFGSIEDVQHGTQVS
jgi:hypothetical protein